MSNIYSVKFMNEASYTLTDKVFKRAANETYLFSAMNILREMNTEINKNTEKLYVQISEAESKSEENKLFAKYFHEFKEIFEKFTNKLNELKSRMIISVENKIDNWSDLICDDEFISSFNGDFSYSGWEFKHIDESDYPRLNLSRIYQKEFDYLGKLMQDAGIAASPAVKLKIIATVSNNFSNHANNVHWITDLIKDMIDVDEKDFSSSYSENIYNALRDKYEINVNKGVLYTCKERLENCEDVMDASIKMCDNLLTELEKVAADISSYLFRNNDNKLKIKTDTDGIIDRDYRLDTYSMNQLDLFMKNKINQIKKVLNVFCIAIGIKFDTVVDYIDQNIRILQLAKEYNSVDPDDIDDDDEDIDDVEDGEEDIEDNDEEMDDDDFEFGEDDSEDKEVVQEEEPEEDIDTEPVDDDTEEFEESYLFESELFDLELMIESYSMYQNIRKALLLEVNQPAQTQTQGTQDQGANKGGTTETPKETPKPEEKQSDNENLKKLADQDKQSIWRRILEKLAELWKRFKEAVFVKSKQKVDYIKNNMQYSTTKVNGKVTLKYTPNFSALNSLSIPDLNYAAMKDSLVDEKTFCTKYFNAFYEDGKSISDTIKTKLLGAEQNGSDNNGVEVANLSPSPFAKTAFEFCSKYTEKVNHLQKQINMLDKAQRVAKDLSKIQESSVNNNFEQYFNEMEDKTNDDVKRKKIDLYFKVCSQVLAAQMTVYQKLFNELYLYCKWHIKQAGGKSDDKKSETTTTTSSATKDDGTVDVKGDSK